MPVPREADPAGDLGESAAAVVDAPRNDLEAERGPSRSTSPEHGRVEECAERVDIVDEQPLQVRIGLQNLRQHAVAQEVGHLVKVAGGIEPLDRQIVGVIGSLALAPGPVEDRPTAGVADFLLVVVERLVAGLFPEKREVAGHRNQPLTDRPAG